MTEFFATLLYHRNTSSPESRHHQLGHNSLNPEVFLRNVGVNLHNTRRQISEDRHSLTSNFSEVMKKAYCSLYITYIKANNSLEAMFTNASALFYLSDFHVQFRRDNAVHFMKEAINSHE
jgi:hypothetical protein